LPDVAALRFVILMDGSAEIYSGRSISFREVGWTAAADG
jgi:hypothetical protein